MEGVPLTPDFFDRDAQAVACDLIGKVIAHRPGQIALRAVIVETEAYYLEDRASHASLGYTKKRRPLFMAPGTIYMYYARGGDSFNVSCAGAGNAVLIKAAAPDAPDVPDAPDDSVSAAAAMIAEMQRRNPLPSGRTRPVERLCSGQTLLCRSLGLRVPDWHGRTIGTPPLELLDGGHRPARLLRTARLGIPAGRDGHFPYRFVDAERAGQATRNPLRGRKPSSGGLEVLSLPPPPAPVAWGDLLRFRPASGDGR